MLRYARILLVTALVSLFTGCATLRHTEFPDSTSNKGRRVTASISHLNIFFLVPPDDIDKLMRDLSEQCGNGEVNGITVSDTRRWLYFLGEFVTIFAAGHCVESAQAGV